MKVSSHSPSASDGGLNREWGSARVCALCQESRPGVHTTLRRAACQHACSLPQRCIYRSAITGATTVRRFLGLAAQQATCTTTHTAGRRSGRAGSAGAAWPRSSGSVASGSSPRGGPCHGSRGWSAEKGGVCVCRFTMGLLARREPRHRLWGAVGRRRAVRLGRSMHEAVQVADGSERRAALTSTVMPSGRRTKSLRAMDTPFTPTARCQGAAAG